MFMAVILFFIFFSRTKEHTILFSLIPMGVSQMKRKISQYTEYLIIPK